MNMSQLPTTKEAYDLLIKNLQQKLLQAEEKVANYDRWLSKGVYFTDEEYTEECNKNNEGKQKLLASQASEARLREALVEANKWMHPRHINSDVEYLATKDKVKQALSTPLNTAELESFVAKAVESEIKKFASEVKGLCQDFSSVSGNVYVLDVKGAIDGLVELYAKKG